MSQPTTSMPPGPVRSAGASWSQRRTNPPLDVGSVERGDVRIAVPAGSNGDRRFVLVAVVHDDLAAAVALVHSTPEMATSADAVLAPSSAGIPFPVIVQTDLVGCVWLSQLGRCVGRIDVEAVQAAVSSGQSLEGIATGPPLRSAVERRWRFKADEGRTLRRLTADATAALLDRIG